MSKKLFRLATAACALVMAFSFAACTNAADDPSDDPDTGYTDPDTGDTGTGDDGAGDDTGDTGAGDDGTGGDGTGGDTGDTGDTSTVSDTVKYASAGQESAAFEWTDSHPENAKVEYKLSTSTAYTSVDEELIRQDETVASRARVDILGLKGGATYDFKITTGDGEIIYITDVEISSYDRSGYAHFNYSEGVGAYNDDGTLKDNAIVIYVSEETKNTVSAVLGGNEYTGIANILSHAGESTVPIDVRIIGTIAAATWNEIDATWSGTGSYSNDKVVGVNGEPLTNLITAEKWAQYEEDGATIKINQEEIIEGGYNTLNTTEYTELVGLTNQMRYSVGDSDSLGNYVDGKFDSYWNMCDINGAENVTVEGVGEDAGLFQWGFTWKSCSSIEVRNLDFDDNTEDACSFEGTDTFYTIDEEGNKESYTPSSEDINNFDSQRIWIHHNNFNEGVNYWDVCPEQDKGEGDGATDIKRLSYITLSYNHYYGNHKTGLVGGSDSQYTANVTFHHNWYEANNSRLPLGRQANMHMYNNYYDGTTGTNMSIRANAYAFIENCYFDNAKGAVTTTGTGVVKLWNNIFVGTTPSASSSIVYASSRTQAVTNSNLFSQDFDTNSEVFYYDSENECSDVTEMLSPLEVKEVIPLVAGTLSHSFNIDIGNSAWEEEGESDYDDSTASTYQMYVASNMVNTTSGLTYAGGVDETETDTTKYSVSNSRISLGGNAAYARLSFEAEEGQTIIVVVNAAAATSSGVKITADNATMVSTSSYSCTTTATDYVFAMTADSTGTVTVELRRSMSSTAYLYNATVVVGDSSLLDDYHYDLPSDDDEDTDGGDGAEAAEHSYAFSYSELTNAITSATGSAADNTILDPGYFTGSNAFLDINVAGENEVYRTAGNGCIQIKEGTISVTFTGTGTLTITVASTGGSNTSEVGLTDSNGNYITATVSTGATETEGGYYTVTGTSYVTLTFDITEAGTYTIVSYISGVYNRGVRIQTIQMSDWYAEVSE